MINYKCINCSWIGEVLSITPLRNKCPVCGDEVKTVESAVEGKVVEQEEKPVPIKDDVKEEVKITKVIPSYDDLKALNSKEQTDILKKLGANNIPKRENDKINLILKLMKGDD